MENNNSVKPVGFTSPSRADALAGAVSFWENMLEVSKMVNRLCYGCVYNARKGCRLW